jgi:hypothetical protein
MNKKPPPSPYHDIDTKHFKMNTTSALKIANIYLNTTLLYGFVRSVTYDYDGKKKYFNSKTGMYETKDILIIDQTGRISINTIAAVMCWPLMLGEDLTRLECAARGKDPKEFQT